MAVVFEAKLYEIKPEELPADTITNIANQWESRLIGMRDEIYNRLKEVIADADAYRKVIGIPASEQFANVLNPNYYKTQSALLKFKVKVLKGAESWLKNTEEAFKEGGRFENGVKGNKTKFMENVKYTIRFVGDKNKVYGCVPKAILCMEGKGAILDRVKSAVDEITGKPVVMFKFAHLPRITASLTNVLVEGLVIGRMSIEAGEDVNAILNTYNAVIEEYVRTYDEATDTYKPSIFLNPNLDPNNTFIKLDYNADTDRLFIHVKQATT